MDIVSLLSDEAPFPPPQLPLSHLELSEASSYSIPVASGATDNSIPVSSRATSYMPQPSSYTSQHGVCEFVDRAIPPVERSGFKFRDGIISKPIPIGQIQNGANRFQITRKISESLPRARSGPPEKVGSSSGKIWHIWGECSGQVV